MKTPRVAIVCDWLTNFAGAERVILAMHEIWPEAPIYTTIYRPDRMPQFAKAEVKTSFIQKLPYFRNKQQVAIVFMPVAVEQFDLSKYDIVISSSHSIAHGVITKPETMHVCYKHFPMRYAWETHSYLDSAAFPSFLKKWAWGPISKLRLWDKLAADRVDQFISNSQNTANRIEKYYRRESKIINPPVDTVRFEITKERGNYFLALGRLVAQKKMDLLVETFNELGLPLKIVGIGPEEAALKKKAKANIEFLGYVDDATSAKLYAEARAYLMPQEEDFGITPLEAMAAGTPVVAFGKGGALETVIHGKTGTFFDKQNKESLKEAITDFAKYSFDAEEIRAHALKYDTEIFKKKIKDDVEGAWSAYPPKPVGVTDLGGHIKKRYEND